MYKNRFLTILFLILLILSSLLYFNQKIQAEDFQNFQGYNSEIDFNTDYEYKLIKYNFFSEENKLDLISHLKNSAYIKQQGNFNDGSITQIGNFGSLVAIIQIGNENSASVKQYANNTKAEVFQFGNNHDLSVEQWGNKGKVYVIQSGNNLENKEVKIIQF